MIFLTIWLFSFVIFLPALAVVDPKPANIREWCELLGMLLGFTFFLSILLVIIYVVGTLF